jgi:nicotinamidase-related amidase
MDMEEWLKLHPGLDPTEHEAIVTKRRVSAFTGSDLEVILRAYNVRHLILAGFSTSGVVLSTVCEAADKDFKLTVLSDASADPDEELHHALMTKIFVKRGDVVPVDEWVKATPMRA